MFSINNISFHVALGVQIKSILPKLLLLLRKILLDVAIAAVIIIVVIVVVVVVVVDAVAVEVLVVVVAELKIDRVVSACGGHWQHCFRTESVAGLVGFTSMFSRFGLITLPSGGSRICFCDTIR